jgi:putative peptidoglycan lipid II flippase
MGAATFLSRILGLVREQVFAVLFGAGHATDAFNIAFRIPNLLRDLFAEGAMSAAFVPTFTRVKAQRGERAGWRLAGLVFRALFLLVSVLSVIGAYYAEELVTLLASHYRTVPGKFELTVLMTRVMFPFFPLVALAAAFMGVLNASGKFFMPGFASALFNFTSILVGVTLFFLAERLGIQPIVGMAIGVVCGGAVQAFCQYPTLRSVGYRWPKKERLDPPWYEEPALKQIGVMMLPGMVGMAATQINVMINSSLASSQGEGAVSYLNYAFRLMQFPIGVFGVSFAAATLPVVSKLWVQKDLEQIEKTLVSSLRSVFAVNLPAAAGLAFLSVPIIELLFQYGAFDAADTLATAKALGAYALGLAAYSAVKVLVPACYAIGQTRAAVASSILSVIFTIALNLLLIDQLGYVGLALGTSGAAILNAAFLFWIVRKSLGQSGGSFHLLPVMTSIAQALALALSMGGVCWVTWHGMEGLVSERAVVDAFSGTYILPAWRSLKVILLCAEGVLFALLSARFFGVTELNSFASRILKRLRR